MREYEAVFIFEPNAEKVAQAKEFTKKEFENAGISIKNEVDMGNRELAYEIQKQSRGHYYLYEIECEPQNLDGLDRTFRLNTEIMKFLFTKK